jgi:hypothetical protein
MSSIHKTPKLPEMQHTTNPTLNCQKILRQGTCFLEDSTKSFQPFSTTYEQVLLLFTTGNQGWLPAEYMAICWILVFICQVWDILYMSGVRHTIAAAIYWILVFILHLVFIWDTQHVAVFCNHSADFITYKHVILNWKWLLCNSQEVIGMRVSFERKYAAPSCCESTPAPCMSKIFSPYFPSTNIFMEFENLCGTTWILCQDSQADTSTLSAPVRLQTCPCAAAVRWNRHLHNSFPPSFRSSCLVPLKRINPFRSCSSLETFYDFSGSVLRY